MKFADCWARLLHAAGPSGDADDIDPARAARISFDADGNERTREKELSLVRYLWEHRHTTPFEMIETWWEMKLPIFIARQLVRHRTVSINEVSRRYVDGAPEYFRPDSWRGRAENAKQGSGEPIADQATANRLYDEAIIAADNAYHALLGLGICPEQARMVLPQSLMTRWLWKQDFHNLLHMLRLRTDPHAQHETRMLAMMMVAVLRARLRELMSMVWR